jgi:hypothetical protein
MYEPTGGARLVLVDVRLRSREWHRRRGLGSPVRCFRRMKAGGRDILAENGHNDLGSLRLPSDVFLLVIGLPLGAADRPADPLGGVSDGRSVLGERDEVPGDKRVVALHSDTGVSTYLSFEDARSGSSSLGESAGTFLEEIEGIEGCTRH